MVDPRPWGPGADHSRSVVVISRAAPANTSPPSEASRVPGLLRPRPWGPGADSWAAASLWVRVSSRRVWERELPAKVDVALV